MDRFGIVLTEYVRKPGHTVAAEGAAQDDVEKLIVHFARESGEIRVGRKYVTESAVTVRAVLVEQDPAALNRLLIRFDLWWRWHRCGDPRRR